MQVITRFNDDEQSLVDTERFRPVVRPIRYPLPVAGHPHRRRAGRATRLLRRPAPPGREPTVWTSPNIVFKPLEPFFGFERSIAFQRVPAWNEVLNGPTEAKLATLADPAWRDRARTDWDNRVRAATSRIDRPHELFWQSPRRGPACSGSPWRSTPWTACTSATLSPSGW